MSDDSTADAKSSPDNVVDWRARYRADSKKFRETRDKLTARVEVLRERNAALIEQQGKLSDRVQTLRASLEAARKKPRPSTGAAIQSTPSIHALHEKVSHYKSDLHASRSLLSSLLTMVRAEGGAFDAETAALQLPDAPPDMRPEVLRLRAQIDDLRSRTAERETILKDRLQKARDLAASRQSEVAEERKLRRAAEVETVRIAAKATDSQSREAVLAAKRDEEARDAILAAQRDGEARATALQHRIDQLQRSLTETRATLQERTGILRDQLGVARAAVAAEKAGSHELTSQIANLHQQQHALSELEAVAAGLRAQDHLKREALVEARNVHSRRVAELQAKLTDARQSVTDLQREQKVQLERAKQQGSDVSSLRAQLEHATVVQHKRDEANEARVQSVAAESDRLRTALESNRVQVEKLKEKLRESRESANATIAQIRAELRECRASAASSLNDTRLEQLTAEVESKLAAAEDIAAHRAVQLREVSTSLNEAQAVAAGFRAQDELKRQAHDAAMSALERELESVNAKLSFKTEEHERALAQLDDIRAVREEQASALQKARDDFNGRLQSMRQDHNAALQSLRDKLAEVREERNARVSELQTNLRNAQRQLGTVDSRDIDPRQHNTADAMDAFFAEAPEVERYEEFGDSLQAALKSHRVTLNKKKVLDAGVGPGYALAELLKRYKPASVHGIDYSAVAIESCRELMPQGTFTVGSLYEPLAEQYDLVLCTEVLEHLDEPDKATQSILNSLKPGGVAIFTVPDGRVDVSRLHLNFWSPESWERFMREQVGDLRLTIDSFQAREASRYRNNLAIVRRPRTSSEES